MQVGNRFLEATLGQIQLALEDLGFGQDSLVPGLGCQQAGMVEVLLRLRVVVKLEVDPGNIQAQPCRAYFTVELVLLIQGVEVMDQSEVVAPLLFIDRRDQLKGFGQWPAAVVMLEKLTGLGGMLQCLVKDLALFEQNRQLEIGDGGLGLVFILNGEPVAAQQPVQCGIVMAMLEVMPADNQLVMN